MRTTKIYCALEEDISDGIQWEDLVDGDRNFVVTVSTLKSGNEEGCLVGEIAISQETGLVFDKEGDGDWSVYLDKELLFKEDIEKMVQEFARKIGRKYKFVSPEDR